MISARPRNKNSTLQAQGDHTVLCIFLLVKFEPEQRCNYERNSPRSIFVFSVQCRTWTKSRDQGLKPALYIVLARTAVPSGERGVPCKKKAHGQQCPSSTSSADLQRNSAYVVTQASYDTTRAWYEDNSFTTPAHHPRGP